MPCAITQEEQEFYEKQSNLEKYGVNDLTGRITTTVACELSKIIERHGLQTELSPMALKWIEKHKIEDETRG